MDDKEFHYVLFVILTYKSQFFSFSFKENACCESLIFKVRETLQNHLLIEDKMTCNGFQGT